MVTDSTPELTRSDLSTVQELVYRLAGIRLADGKKQLVQHRLSRRLRERHLDSYHDYCQLLGRSEEEAERQRFLNALTTNETYFFRHKQHWDFIIDHLIPAWRAARHPPRIWSAACSTGEEPYSVAILMRELFMDKPSTIDATDINDLVLRTAREGTYGSYALQKVTPLCLERYFEPATAERWTVTKKVRDLVNFRQVNLLQTTSGSAYDLILCRNVLIYFDDASKDRALRVIAQRMSPTSYLMIGGAESLGSLHTYFEFQAPGIYRKVQHA